MKHVFKDYQRRASRYANPLDQIALFMEMRLGKSPVVIRWTERLRVKRILLVAPLSTLIGSLNWEGELRREEIAPIFLSNLAKEKRMTTLRPTQLHDGRLTRRWARGWFGVNYEALRTQPELLSAPWDVIILDESTRIRSPRAQITKTLLKRTDHIPHKAILTGLPNPEDPMDYFCQFVFLHGSFMGFDNFWSFRHALFYNGYSNWDWIPKPKTRDRIKAYVHKHAFVLTRKQAGVGSKKVRQQRSVELNAAQRKVLKQMKTKFEVDGVETKWTTVLNTWMQRVAGGFHPSTLEILSDAKMRLAEELIMENFRTEPVVMWFRFNEEIDAFASWMKRRHRARKLARVYGATDKVKRPKIQERFQNGDINLILMQIKIKFGWNLSRSSTVIYYSNSYEFEDRSQSEDRVIHLTKKDECLYLDLVTLGTPDEDLVSALSDKRMNAQTYNRQLQSAVVRYIR